MTPILSKEEQAVIEHYLEKNEGSYIRMYRCIADKWKREPSLTNLWSDCITDAIDEVWEGEFYYGDAVKLKENPIPSLSLIAYMLSEMAHLQYRYLHQDYLRFNRDVHWIMSQRLHSTENQDTVKA